MAVEITPDQAMQLLDFNQKFDIALLDNVVNQFYGGYGQQVCLFRLQNNFVGILAQRASFIWRRALSKFNSLSPHEVKFRCVVSTCNIRFLFGVSCP